MSSVIEIGRVPEALGDDLRVHTGLGSDRRVRMPQVVQPDTRQPARLDMRLRELRQGKAVEVRAVRETDEALVRALEANLDGSSEATAAEWALAAARKKADGPCDARIEAASRLVSQGQQRRSHFVQGNLPPLLDEMAVRAKGWPERARAALDELESVAVEYEQIARPEPRRPLIPPTACGTGASGEDLEAPAPPSGATRSRS